jgi:hypothetical protein
MASFIRRASGALLIGLLIAACGGSTTTSGAPSIAIPSLAIPSIEMPSVEIPSIPAPSIVDRPDPELAARFPTALEGATLGEVQTSSYLAIVNAFVEPDAAQQFVNTVNTAGMNASELSYGSQLVTFDENTVVAVEAVRAPGRDANAFVAIWPQLTQILQPDDPAPTITATTLGGKNVTALTLPDDDVSYLYVTGDVVWRIRGGDEDQITTILEALH